MMRRVLDYTGRENLLEVWPNLCMFAHGGVEFAPYRRSFEALIPSDRMQYMETYNASEGFFALADDPSRSDMLLMLDYGNFFEFRSGDTVVPLEGVECGKVYAVTAMRIRVRTVPRSVFLLRGTGGSGPLSHILHVPKGGEKPLFPSR